MKLWMIESGLALLIFFVNGLIFGLDLTMWLGIFACWFSFMRNQVSIYLAEKQEKMIGALYDTEAFLECFRYQGYYGWLAEIFFLFYFLKLGASVALCSVFVSALYRFWRYKRSLRV